MLFPCHRSKAIHDVQQISWLYLVPSWTILLLGGLSRHTDPDYPPSVPEAVASDTSNNDFDLIPNCGKLIMKGRAPPKSDFAGHRPRRYCDFFLSID